MRRVRILHISDLHERAARETETWRRRRVLGDAWLRQLDDLSTEGSIDLLVFTGDAADRGQAAEFGRATDFLEVTLKRLHLDSERLFVVPGNHDIDRAAEPQHWRALRHAIASANDSLSVTRWISGGTPPPGFADEWRPAISRRLQAYRDWVSNGLGRPELAGNETQFGYRKTLNLGGANGSIHIFGLNTAWLCGDDNDSGKLWILDEQLMRLAADEQGNPLTGCRLLLMHHPFDHMADGAVCRRLLKGHVDLVLRGHLHEEEFETWSDPNLGVRQLAAGCLYEGNRSDQWPNACHVITLNGDGSHREAEVRFRRWSARGGHWHDDNGLFQGSQNGRVTWTFSRLPQATPAHRSQTMPADPWKPAVPPAFVGREVLLKKLRNAWEHGRSVSLVGDWRIGKSSILTTCFGSIAKSGRAVRYLNGGSREGASPAVFVGAVTGDVAPADPDGAADLLAAWARQERRPGVQPLLLVDECDVLVRRFDYRFFERLRGMLDDLCLGVSSRRELDLAFKEAGKGASPFQNRLELHWVGLLEPEAADQLLESVGGTLEPKARQAIRESAGRHPFFIQLMARKFLDGAEFGQTDVEAVEEFRAEAAARLRELWQTLTDRERRILVEAVHVSRPDAIGLRRRGLLDENGRVFARVLGDWLVDESM